MLVLRPGALGDTLLAVPALRALRRAGLSVTLAAHGGAARLLEVFGEVTTGLAFDDPSLTWLFSPSGAPDKPIVAWMRERPAGLPRTALVAPSRPPDGNHHCARHLLESLAPLGIDLSWDDRPLATTAISSNAVLVHPGSGALAKNWPAERFAAVIRALDAPVTLIVGEADMAAADAVERGVGRRLERFEGLPLRDLAARLAGCHAYLGNDSGVSHLAGLCGAHTVALFGPTRPEVWRPIGPDVQALAFDVEASAVVDALRR